MTNTHGSLNTLGQFYIDTPMTDALREQVTRWLWCGFTGGLILGESRTGKTQAIRALDNSFPSRTGESVPVHRVIFGNRDNKTIKEAWLKIAKSTGITTASRASTSEDLSSQVAFYLAEAAFQNDTRQVVLIVDEAQFLTITQLSVFAELHNLLDEAKVNPMIVFVANQDKFKDLASSLMLPENRYIRERFFDNIHPFFGIRELSELEACLAAIDGQDEQDAESGCSITQQYLDQLYHSGFRLQPLAPLIWDIYSDHFRAESLRQSWGMAFFSRFIKILLEDYLPRYDCESDSALKSMIMHSFKASCSAPMLDQFYR